MKVKELREEIANLPDDAEVCIQMSSGCCGDFEYLGIEYLDSFAPDSRYGGSLNIRVEALPGYESCISSGRMSKLAQQIQKEREDRNSPKKDD